MPVWSENFENDSYGINKGIFEVYSKNGCSAQGQNVSFLFYEYCINTRISVNTMGHLYLFFTRQSPADYGNPHIRTWNPVGLLTLSHSCCRPQ